MALAAALRRPMLGDPNIDAFVKQARLAGGFQLVFAAVAACLLTALVSRLRAAGSGGWSMRTPRAAALRLVPIVTVFALFFGGVSTLYIANQAANGNDTLTSTALGLTRTYIVFTSFAFIGSLVIVAYVASQADSPHESLRSLSLLQWVTVAAAALYGVISMSLHLAFVNVSFDRNSGLAPGSMSVCQQGDCGIYNALVAPSSSAAWIVSLAKGLHIDGCRYPHLDPPLALQAVLGFLLLVLLVGAFAYTYVKGGGRINSPDRSFDRLLPGGGGGAAGFQPVGSGIGNAGSAVGGVGASGMVGASAEAYNLLGLVLVVLLPLTAAVFCFVQMGIGIKDSCVETNFPTPDEVTSEAQAINIASLLFYDLPNLIVSMYALLTLW